MKKLLILLSLQLLVLGTVTSQKLMFSVRPGFNLNGAYFGTKLNNFAPFGGVQYLLTSSKLQAFGDNIVVNAGIVMPFVGVKYFVSTIGNVKPYFIGIISKPFLIGTYRENGVVDPFVQESLDKIGLWSTQDGFGVEYFFSERFSLGGEFGVRFIFVNYKEDVDLNFKFNLNWTYSNVTLNYYL